jgi:hypothetical protein
MNIIKEATEVCKEEHIPLEYSCMNPSIFDILEHINPVTQEYLSTLYKEDSNRNRILIFKKLYFCEDFPYILKVFSSASIIKTIFEKYIMNFHLNAEQKEVYYIEIHCVGRTKKLIEISNTLDFDLPTIIYSTYYKSSKFTSKEELENCLDSLNQNFRYLISDFSDTNKIIDAYIESNNKKINVLLNHNEEAEKLR